LEGRKEKKVANSTCDALGGEEKETTLSEGTSMILLRKGEGRKRERGNSSRRDR